MGLQVLITNIELWPPSGTVLYVRDLALELQRQGHTPVVFSSTAGSVAEELRAAGRPSQYLKRAQNKLLGLNRN